MTRPAETPATADPDPSPRGIVELICGCMFSGKTTQLLERLRNEPAESICIIKHDKDQRYHRSRVMTHTGDGAEAVTAARARDILDRVARSTEVVAVDEGHFYDAALPEICSQLAREGKRVIVTSLDLDMWGLPFANIEALKQIAGVVCIQHAVCASCGQPATHTYRKTPIRNRNLVGGADDFEPRCQACWSPPPEEHIDSNEMT